MKKKQKIKPPAYREYLQQTFGVWFLLCHHMPQQEFAKLIWDDYKMSLRQLHNPGTDGLCVLLENEKGHQTIVVWTAPNTSIGTAAHECLHAVNKMLHERGYRPIADNDEVQAYLLTEIMNQLCGQ